MRVERKCVHCTYNPVWSGIKNFAWPAEYIQMGTHSNTKILDPGFCFTVNSISGLLRYSNISRRRTIIAFIYEEVRKYLDIYEEAVSHIWLCTCSFTRFPLFLTVHLSSSVTPFLPHSLLFAPPLLFSFCCFIFSLPISFLLFNLFFSFSFSFLLSLSSFHLHVFLPAFYFSGSTEKLTFLHSEKLHHAH